MAEDIQGLIEKINQEGILAAREKANTIEQQAKDKAEQIIAGAKAQAEKILEQARDTIAKMQEKEKALRAQAGRDLLLVLRKEINGMLERLIVRDARAALTPESMVGILVKLIEHVCKRDKDEVIVFFNKDDAHNIEKHFLATLKEETKKQIVVRSADDIHAGFVISYDAGKSQFDFSDKALAEYISTYLKPKLKEILQG